MVERAVYPKPYLIKTSAARHHWCTAGTPFRDRANGEGSTGAATSRRRRPVDDALGAWPASNRKDAASQEMKDRPLRDMSSPNRM